MDVEVIRHERSAALTPINCQAEDWLRRHADPSRTSWMKDGSARIQGSKYSSELISQLEIEGFVAVEH